MLVDQEYELASVNALREHPANPRRGNVEVISESIAASGFYGAVIVQRSTGYVLAGNHRLRAARRAGIATLPVIWVDVDDERAARILAVDNRANDLAGYDEAALVALLGDLSTTTEGLLGSGYTAEDLLALQGVNPDAAVALTDPDDVPDAPAPVVKPGQVWVLGPHRLVCGDSTDAATVRAVIGAERADVMWTDPPYGISYQDVTLEVAKATKRRLDGLRVANDGAGDLPVLLRGFLTVAREVALRAGAPGYVCAAPGPLQTVVAGMLEETGWSLRQQLVWVKDAMVLGHFDYHAQHEPIWMGYTPAPKGSGRLGRGGGRWYGDNSATTVLEVARPKRSAEHPTMKPVELIVRMLRNSCPPDGVVFEPFGGSGSTLIAAHTFGARARVIELDPRYCDVICRRYQGHTGVVPVLESTGQARSFVGVVDGVEVDRGADVPAGA